MIFLRFMKTFETIRANGFPQSPQSYSRDDIDALEAIFAVEAQIAVELAMKLRLGEALIDEIRQAAITEAGRMVPAIDAESVKNHLDSSRKSVFGELFSQLYG